MALGHKFIYVFSKADEKYMRELGFSPVKCDEANDVYIFVNDLKLQFCEGKSLEGVRYIAADTLTF